MQPENYVGPVPTYCAAVRLPFDQNIGTPFTAALGKVHINFFWRAFVFEYGTDGRTDGQDR